MAPFSSFFKDFKRVVNKQKNPSLLGIDVGSSSLKVVQLHVEKGHIALETYGEIALGPYMGNSIGEPANLPPDKLIQALSDAIQHARITTKNAAISIPLSASLVTKIELPAVGDDKLESMVPLEARKYIPLPIEEISLDWQKIGIKKTDTGEVNEILIYAVHKDVISGYQAAATALEIDVTFYELEVFSTIRSVLERGLSAAVIVDIGARYTKMYGVQNELVTISRKISNGSLDITKIIAHTLHTSFDKAEEIKRGINLETLPSDGLKRGINDQINLLGKQIKKFIQEFSAQITQTDFPVVITGGGTLLKGLPNMIAKSVGNNLQLAQPLSAVETPEFLSRLAEETGPEYSVAIGLALRKAWEEF